jgi:hypothetical protein
MFKLETAEIIDIQRIMGDIFGDDLHKKRQTSLAYTAMGLLESNSLFLHEMGAGMAQKRGTNKKHGIKQIDRMLSNPGFDIWALSASWVPYVIGSKTELMVALDWTSFAGDDQHMLSLNILTSKGCSTPLLWRTVDKSKLKHNRGRYEDQMLSRLKEVLPEGVSVTIVADRGFADRKFFEFIEQTLKFNYIIRIKANTTVKNAQGIAKKASEWLEESGKAKSLKDIKLTQGEYPVRQFVCVRDRGMKAAWYLVSNLEAVAGRTLIKHYGKRWKIEPYFRDVKSGRYGYGLRETHIKSEERRDRLFLVVALCYTLLMLLGQAGENIGFDKHLKANTVKTRTHSLFRQGQYYLSYFVHFKPEDKRMLIESFAQLLTQHDFWLAFYDLNK